MFNEISVQRLAAGTTFKLVAIGMLATFVPFSVLMGCFALFGANTLTWNNQNIYGVTAIVASPFIGLLIALVFTLFLGSAMAFGLWVYSKFRLLTLLVKQIDGGAND
jgi:hypothetical protein